MTLHYGIFIKKRAHSFQLNDGSARLGDFLEPVIDFYLKKELKSTKSSAVFVMQTLLTA